jgi:cytosol alanyl aminopeptidase
MTRARSLALWSILCLVAWSGCVSKGAAPVATQPSAAPQAIPVTRLPSGVRPLSYGLELLVFPKRERFSGRVRIAVQLDAPTQTVWMHGKGLSVTTVIAHWPGRASQSGSYHQVNEEGIVALHFAQPLPAGQGVVELIYDAAFDRDLKGLYRVDVGGDSYAFTQFEPTFARQVFPCFDEPAFKVPFDVWLTVPAGDTVASNTEIVAQEPAAEGGKRVRFATTPPLPTYLVALTVGPLDVVEAPAVPPTPERPKPLPLRALAVRGKGSLLAHALADTARLLPAFEAYFGGPYPYSKLDLVAVPDFGAGAMENAGLITFRDYLLLIDPAQATEGQLRASASVISHELAHHWFGNLVTMRYWDDLWLNEGFATWIGQRTVAALYPEHKADLALLGAAHGAMDADSRVSARVVRQPIASSHDIANAFDTITYNKGAALLSMFERYLGPATFQRGVREYLRAHAWGNASTEDFLGRLSAAAGQDLTPGFSSFLTQVGVPLLAAEVACDGPRAELRLRQGRYVPLGSAATAQGRWQLPVCVRYEGDGIREQCAVLASESAALPLEGAGCPTWLMPNAEAAGYYQFALAPADLAKLRDHAAKLSVRERYALVDSLLAAFDSGALPGRDVLAALPAFVGDAERSVATAPMGLLRKLRRDVVEEARRPAIEAWIRKLYQPLAKRLGFHAGATDDGDTKLLRGEVLYFLADIGRDSATRKQAARLGEQYLGADDGLHPEVVPAEVADLAVRMYVAEGDAARWEAVYERFKRSDDAVLRGRLLRALAAVRDGRSARALGLCLDPALRVNETLVPLREQLADAQTRTAAWAWLEANFDALAARLSLSNMGSVPALASVFCDDASASRVQAFFEPRVHGMSGGPRSLASATEAIRLCAASATAQRQSVQAFLSER